MGDVVWLRNRGQNEWDSLVDIPLDQSAVSLNVHLFNGGLGTRRGGSISITITGVTAPINALIEYLPGQDDSVAELFVVDASATTKILRSAGGSSFSNLTLKDNVASEPYTFSAATLNGKLYLAYDSTVNRLHVFDPGLSTTEVRRAGMGTPAAPTAATMGGAGLTFTGTYKVAYTEQRSSVTVRRSELSGSVAVSITDDSGITVTKPASISEGETHWELYRLGSDGVTYYLLATTVVGTTTVNDTSATPPSTTAEPTIGSNTPFPSVKSIGTDGSRLYGLGVWESSAGDSLAPKAGRFYFGPVLDSSITPYAVHDDERINNTTTLSGWIDLARNANGADRGVSPCPVNNVIYAFQSQGVYALVPTDSAIQPFRRRVLDRKIGNLSQQAIVVAQDRNGSPCCFFLDPAKGPYTVGGQDGLKWCGKDVATTWASVSRDAATLTSWGIWFPDLGQVWFGVAVNASTPNKILVLDVTEQKLDEDGDLRGGWTIYDGDIANARAAVVFSNTLGITRSRFKVPYTGGNSKLLQYSDNVNRDDTTSYQAYARSGELVVDKKTARLDRAYVLAEASSGVTLRHTLIANAGTESRGSDIVLTAAGSETVVHKKVEDAAMQDLWSMQVELGDQAAANVHWELRQWRGRIMPQGDL